MTDECVNCHWFRPGHKHPKAVLPSDGICVRYPPTATSVMVNANTYEDTSFFPKVMTSTFCGEHQPKLTPA